GATGSRAGRQVARVDLQTADPYAPPAMRVAAGVAVALGVLAAPILVSAADIYLLRDRQGVLHLTNAPVDPGSKLVIRQPPRVPFPRVLTLEPIGPRLPPLLVPQRAP